MSLSPSSAVLATGLRLAVEDTSALSQAESIELGGTVSVSQHFGCFNFQVDEMWKRTRGPPDTFGLRVAGRSSLWRCVTAALAAASNL